MHQILKSVWLTLILGAFGFISNTTLASNCKIQEGVYTNQEEQVLDIHKISQEPEAYLVTKRTPENFWSSRPLFVDVAVWNTKFMEDQKWALVSETQGNIRNLFISCDQKGALVLTNLEDPNLGSSFVIQDSSSGQIQFLEDLALPPFLWEAKEDLSLLPFPPVELKLVQTTRIPVAGQTERPNHCSISGGIFQRMDEMGTLVIESISKHVYRTSESLSGGSVSQAYWYGSLDEWKLQSPDNSPARKFLMVCNKRFPKTVLIDPLLNFSFSVSQTSERVFFSPTVLDHSALTSVWTRVLALAEKNPYQPNLSKRALEETSMEFILSDAAHKKRSKPSSKKKLEDIKKFLSNRRNVATMPDGKKYYVGASLAAALGKETFNLYRTLKNNQIVPTKIHGPDIEVLIKQNLVRPGTHSVTLIPDEAFNQFFEEKIRQKAHRSAPKRPEFRLD